MIVVDASLAVKWLIAEPDSGDALHFLDINASELVGPDLLLIEIGGALVRRANMGLISAAEATGRLSVWIGAYETETLSLLPTTQTRLMDAASLAVQLGHPLKDCIYLALAIELDCELATCDAKFQARAVELYPKTRLLSSYA